MTEQPCEQLDPKMKTVWRIRDTATTTIIYACALFLGALLVGSILRCGHG